jgi:VCBS repeat-containing protein
MNSPWLIAVRAAMTLAMSLALAWLPGVILAAPDTPVTTADRTHAVAGRASATDLRQFVCPCRLWTESDVPAWASFPADAGPIELGVKFRSSVPGVILGIRFYKGAQNVSSHTGSLWTANGELLAIGWFDAVSPSGWQEMRFAAPVRIQAGATYVASYHTDVGYYAATNAYFDTAVTRGPLTALASSEGGNGVYRYGVHAFPDQTYQATNYWVDVVFAPAPPNTPPAARADGYTLSGPRLSVPAPGVLANDTDPESDTLIAQLVAGPSAGDLTLNRDGSFTYAPNASYTGMDHFAYVAGDGWAASQPVTVTITGAASACLPRPRVQVAPAAGGGRLDVVVAATPLSGQAPTALSSLRFGTFRNARVSLNGQPIASGQAVALSPNTTRVTFSVTRATPGQATTVPLVVVDGCGEWPTFVGGGIRAGF